LENKVLDIVDARCNHEVQTHIFQGTLRLHKMTAYDTCYKETQ